MNTSIRSFSRPLLINFLALLVLVFTVFPVQAADVFSQQFRGTFSYATFEIPGPSPCTTIFASIFGNTTLSVEKGNVQIGSTVEAVYILFDVCSSTYLQTANGVAQFPGSSGFHMQPSLNSAKIQGSFIITDSSSGDSIPVVLDVVLTGVGDIIDQKIIDHAVGPDYVLNGRYIGRSTFAVPSGTVTFGTTTYDLAQASYFSSYFGVADSGFISITHQ